MLTFSHKHLHMHNIVSKFRVVDMTVSTYSHETTTVITFYNKYKLKVSIISYQTNTFL